MVMSIPSRKLTAGAQPVFFLNADESATKFLVSIGDIPGGSVPLSPALVYYIMLAAGDTSTFRTEPKRKTNYLKQELRVFLYGRASFSV